MDRIGNTTLQNLFLSSEGASQRGETCTIQQLGQNALQQQSLAQSSITPLPIVPLHLIWDIDSLDHNGAMLKRLSSALASHHPVITTRTLLRSACWESNVKNSVYDMAIPWNRRDTELEKIATRYEIYTKGAYLVFIPQKKGDPTTSEEQLAQLDLHPNALKKITLEEAWQQIEESSSFEGFRQLFSNCPTQPKLFCVAGHGHVGHPAGLTAEHYLEFLRWAETHHCQGLLLTGCYSGGMSNLLHLPQAMEKGVRRGVSFPVIVRSIGEFPTREQETEQDVHTFVTQFCSLLNTPGGRTISRLKKLFQEQEKGKGKKQVQSFAQAYFPCTSDSPGGFHPIGEGKKSQSLTYVEYRKCEVKKGFIPIIDKKFLEISSAVIDCPLVLQEKTPIFLSVIPGPAQHLFTKVVLQKKTPHQFLEEQADFYQQAEVGVPKMLLIGTLKSNQSELHQVFIDLQSGECGYSEGGQYFVKHLREDKSPVSLTPLQFFLRWKLAVARSRPGTEALRAATGGQQGERELRQLKQESFWQEQQKVHDFYQSLMDALVVSSTNLQQLVKNCTEPERISLLCYLLAFHEEAACCFLEQNIVSPDATDEIGVPLVIHAAYRQRILFMEKLIEQGVNLNKPHPKDRVTCLVIALEHRNTRFVNLLLQQNAIDLLAENKRGNPAFSAAVLDLTSLQACVAKKTKLDCNREMTSVVGDKMSLLTVAMRSGTKEVVQHLLKSGADPNAEIGERLPLIQAICLRDRDKISLLLDYGADPYQQDKQGQSPLTCAMERSCVSIVQELLMKKPKIENQGQLEAVFLAALQSAEEAKIRLLLQSKFPFPKKFSFAEKEQVKTGLKRLILFGRGDLLQELIERAQENGEGFCELVADFLLEQFPEKLRDVSQSCQILEKQVKTEAFLTRAYERGGAALLKKAMALGSAVSEIEASWQELWKKVMERGDLLALQLFEEKGVSVDVQQMLVELQEALAIMRGEMWHELVIALLQRVDQKQRGQFLREKIQAILFRKNSYLLRFALLDNGVDPNCTVGDLFHGNGPLLFKAIETKSAEIVQIVLEAKPNLSKKFEGRTPLQHAQKLGLSEIISLLQPK